jgi:tetratricopeptide (TPR) repeat protein
MTAIAPITMTMRIRIIVVIAVIGTLAACGRAPEYAIDNRLASLHARALAQPDSITPWVALGEASMQLWFDTDDPTLSATAILAAQTAAALGSSDASVMSLLARVHFARSEFREAIKALNEMLRQNSTTSDAWGMLADAYQELGRYRSADSCYFVMYEMDPGFNSLRRIARVTAALRSYDDAVGYIDRAIEQNVPDPDLAAALTEQGELFLSHGFVDGARRSATRALELQPELLPALELRARIFAVDDDVTGEMASYEALVRLSPNPRYKSMLASAYAQGGRQRQADSLVTTAKADFETLWEQFAPIVIRDRIEFLLEWDLDPTLALELARRETRHRKDIRGYELLAWAYLKNGNAELAWSSMSFALRQGAREPRLFHRAALIAKAAGKTDKYKTFSARARAANSIIEKLYGPL